MANQKTKKITTKITMDKFGIRVNGIFLSQTLLNTILEFYEKSDIPEDFHETFSIKTNNEYIGVPTLEKIAILQQKYRVET